KNQFPVKVHNYGGNVYIPKRCRHNEILIGIYDMLIRCLCCKIELDWNEVYDEASVPKYCEKCMSIEQLEYLEYVLEIMVDD
ncbi:MAG: hypothetical protein HeimC3_55270, partial [Candidatus Heimdallarchaeota archaeon LC_3]